MAHRNTRKFTGRPTFQAAVKALTTSSLALGAALSLAPTASAVDHFWIQTSTVNDGATADFNTATNWTPATVPGTADNADIINGGTVYITQNGASNDLNPGGTQSGGTAGNATTGNGTVTMTSGTFGVGSNGGWLRIGYTNLANGDTASASTGTLNVQGGTMNFGTNTAAQFNIGEANGNTGIFNLSGGTFNANTSAYTGMGTAATATGVMTVSGSGVFNNLSTATRNVLGSNNVIGAPIVIGTGGTGTLTIQDQGVINTNGEIWVGNAQGATGTLNINGGTINAHSWVAVARNSANGTVNMTGGVLNKDSTSNGGSHITFGGLGTGQTGNWNMTGGTINVATGGNTIWLAEGNAGNFNISGGRINANDGIVVTNGTGAGLLYLQDSTTATGALTNGGGNEVVTAPTVTLTNGTGTATVILQGGTLVTGGFAAGSNTSSTNKQLFLAGGTIQASANNAAFFGGTTTQATLTTLGGTATVGGTTPSVTFNTNGFNIGINTALAGSSDNGLTKTGLGVLTLTNGANSYAGTTNITGGAIDAQVTGSLPGLNTAGRVNVGAAGALVVGVGYSTGQSTADIDTARTSNTFAAGGSIGLDTATTNSPYTYGTNLTPAYTTDFYKLGAGTLNLTGQNTYTGTTYFNGGLLSGNIGGGALSFNGGGFQAAANSTVDYSGRAVSFNGTVLVNTNGGNVTFGSSTNAITGNGTGQLIKQGQGTLTIAGALNFTPTTATLTNVFVNQGTLAFTGSNVVARTGGNYISVGQNPGDFGTMNVANGASFTTTGDFNIGDVGGGTGTTPVNGLDGGVINITGANTAVTGGSVYIGKGGNTAANGAVAVGVLNHSSATGTNTFTSAQNVQVGAYGQGQYNLGTGGIFNHTGGFISIGRQTGSFGVVDVNGGTINDTAAGTRTIVGELGTGVLNVRNGGVVNANSSTTNANSANLSSAAAALTIGNTAGAAAATPTVGIVNLLPGGTINTQSIGSLAAANQTSQLNFSGGTLKNTVATTTFIQNLTQANVYGNVGGTTVSGAVIDTTAGNATISQALVIPAGSGVTSISTATTTTAGTGTFSTTPIVQITGGGGGVGATAVANLAADGTISSFTITNPGTGYTSAPTVTVTGASGTIVTSTSAIAANVSGGLTKNGANILTLTGNNTYTGPTIINAGTLALSGTGSIAASSQIFTTATAATFSVASPTTFAAGQNLMGQGTIQGGANALTVNGAIRPSMTGVQGSIGTLTIATTGSLTLSSTAVVNLDIADAANKDLINAPGAQLTLSGTLAVAGSPTTNTPYVVFSGLATETGTFTRVTVAGQDVTSTTTQTYANGNFTVSFAVVPEPSTWALGVFGLGGLAAVWMRRRRIA